MSDPMHSPPVVAARAVCGAKTRGGGTCINHPVTGATRCRMHGGASPAVLAKAAVNRLEAKVRGELKSKGWAPVTDPLTHYADLGGEILAFKDLARERINVLQSWETPEVGMLAEDTRAAVQVYERALDRADKILASMLRLGLDAEALRQGRERPSREQADQVVGAFRKVTDGLGLTVDQQALLPGLFAAAMSELTEAGR